MGKPRKTTEVEMSPRRPARSLEDRENQLVEMATDLAAAQLADGTASAMVITHFLKLGSTDNLLEKEKKRNEILLMQAKAEHIASLERMEELAIEAMRAMSTYKGETQVDQVEVMELD